MAELIFEIWQNHDDNSFEMSAVSERGDQVRSTISPRAVRIHIFTAQSENEAAQKNNDYHGWGRYEPIEGLADRRFTDAELEEQRQYLAVRHVS